MRLHGIPPHTMRLLWLAIALAAWLALALGSGVTRAQAAPDMLVGIEQNGSMEVPANREQNFETMNLLGARVARFVLRFDQVATCDPRGTGGGAANQANPCYNWGVPDGVVASAQQRGIQVIFSVVGVPAFVHGNPNYGAVGTSDAQFNEFRAIYADFVSAAATHYGGRVAYWTIWNEPNSTYFFSPQKLGGEAVSPARYASLYDVAARRLKAVSPGVKVAPGPTGSASTIKPGTFIKGFLAALPDSAPIDAYAHNPYLQDSPDPETQTRNWRAPSGSHLKAPWIGLGNLGDLTNLLDRDRASQGVPLWLTEFAYETAPDPNGVDQAKAAAWTAEALYTGWTNPRVKMFVWYALFDDGNGGSEGFQSGLFSSPGTCGQQWCPKPGAYMFRHATHVSTETAKVGQTITVWGQARVAPAKARLYIWEGEQWLPFENVADANGSLWITWKLRGPAWFVTCDVACGPIRQVVVG